MLITPRDAVSENRKQCVDTFLKDIAPKGSVLPILANADNSQKLEVIGSCTLLKHRGYYFILTAAHCVKHDKVTYVSPISEPNTSPDSKLSFLQKSSWNLIENCGLDFAMTEVLSHEIEQLGCTDDSFFTLGKLSSDYDDDSHFIVSGFSCKKNSSIQLVKNQSIEHYASSVQHSPLSNIASLYKIKGSLKSTQETHLHCEYNLETIFEDNAPLKQKHFNPKGISGGALIYINQGKKLMLDAKAKFSLSGIIIELHENVRDSSQSRSDILISTKIDSLVPNIDHYIDEKYSK